MKTTWSYLHSSSTSVWLWQTDGRNSVANTALCLCKQCGRPVKMSFINTLPKCQHCKIVRKRRLWWVCLRLKCAVSLLVQRMISLSIGLIVGRPGSRRSRSWIIVEFALSIFCSTPVKFSVSVRPWSVLWVVRIVGNIMQTVLNWYLTWVRRTVALCTQGRHMVVHNSTHTVPMWSRCAP